MHAEKGLLQGALLHALVAVYASLKDRQHHALQRFPPMQCNIPSDMTNASGRPVNAAHTQHTVARIMQEMLDVLIKLSVDLQADKALGGAHLG